MLMISSRACQLGSSINTRTEKHGDDDVPACDIPLAGIMLDERELNALLGDPYAHRALFTDKAGHKEPTLPQVEGFVLKAKIENVTVRIGHNLLDTSDKDSRTLTDCKLKGLTLEPMSGGATALSCKVQTSGDHVGSLVGALIAHLGQHVAIEFSEGAIAVDGDDTQLDLPVNNFGNGEEPETGESPAPTRRRGRKGAEDRAN